MAAEIFNPPEDIKVPEIDFANFNLQKYEEANQKYIDDLKVKLQEMGYTGKNAGEVIQFPVADGYAQYMVISMRPLQLMHLPLGDAWHYPNVDLMTAQRVQEMINQQKAMAKLFGKK